MEEIWKPVPGFEHIYEASSAGNVRSCPRNYFIQVRRKKQGSPKERVLKDELWWRPGRVLKPIDARNHWVVHLHGQDRSVTQVSVAHVVWAAFHGVSLQSIRGCRIRFKDGNCANASIGNLELR